MDPRPRITTTMKKSWPEAPLIREDLPSIVTRWGEDLDVYTELYGQYGFGQWRKYETEKRIST